MPRGTVTDEGVHPADYTGRTRGQLTLGLYLLTPPDHLDLPHWVRLRPIDQHAALIQLAADIIKDATLSEAETDPLKVVEEWQTALLGASALLRGAEIAEGEAARALSLKEGRANMLCAAAPVVRIAETAEAVLSCLALMEPRITRDAGADRSRRTPFNEGTELTFTTP